MGDRVDEHMVDFASYEAVGPVGENLGTFLEIGEKRVDIYDDCSVDCWRDIIFVIIAFVNIVRQVLARGHNPST